MTANRIRVTTAEYAESIFDYYEFFANETDLTLANVEADASVFEVADASTWIHAGLNPGDTWYYWVRTVRRNGTGQIKSGFLAIGPVTVEAIGYDNIQDVSNTDRLLGRQTAGAGIIEEITCTAAGRALLAAVSAAAQAVILGAGSASGLATLDAGGKVPTAQLPAIAITDAFAVASQAAMLALTAEKGDIAIRSDLNKTFILSTNSPGTLADWLELKTPTDAVQSVAGKTGVVTLQLADLTDASANGQSLVAAANYAAMRTLLGLVIGTNVQAFDATLASLAGLGSAADKMAYTTGVDTWAETGLSAFMRTVLDDANAATALATLGAQAALTDTTAALTLQNSWVAYVGTPQVRKYGKVVQLHGLINSGVTSSGTLITTLPAGYRPSELTFFELVSQDLTTKNRVYVDTDGTVTISSCPASSWIGLDSIVFITA